MKKRVVKRKTAAGKKRGTEARLSAAAQAGASGERAATVTLAGKYGLHMRPAKDVVELANSFPCDISLIAKGRDVDAKSILSIIGLGAECGDTVEIRARGPRAEEAAKALAELLASPD